VGSGEFEGKVLPPPAGRPAIFGDGCTARISRICARLSGVDVATISSPRSLTNSAIYVVFVGDGAPIATEGAINDARTAPRIAHPYFFVPI
jgi:hypothetical protein